jgi:hypothetical protein
MNILIFTDSRGQHKPLGQNHLLFSERLALDSRLKVKIFLCPFKWTTTVDFLQHFPSSELKKFEAVILYTGIVDWSPRPVSSAINELYNNQTTANLSNLEVNTNDYQKKIVNNKKDAYDSIFGFEAMRMHFSNHFPIDYEGEYTTNMYSIEMARASLIGRLSEIDNLLFINANRFVPGWRGDYKKDRPSNISITHEYSDFFSQALADRLVDLRAWDNNDVMRMTCDNLHLTRDGSDYIFDKICAKLDLTLGKTLIPIPNSIMNLKESQKMTAEHNPVINELDVVVAINREIRKLNFIDAYNRSMSSFKRTGKSSYFHAAFFCANKMQDRGKIQDLLNISKNKSDTIISQNSINYNYLRTFAFLFPESVKSFVVELSKRPVLSSNEVVALENKMLDENALRNFINSRRATFETRFANEYQYLKRLPIEFPYNYLTDYNGNSIFLRSKSDAKPTSISFIYPIKNRNKRTRISLLSLNAAIINFHRKNGGDLCIEVLIVEDKDDDSFDSAVLDTLAFDSRHYLVSTGVSWTRSGLLNYGLKNAKGEMVFFVDCDVLFPLDFFNHLSDSLLMLNLTRHIIAVNMIETHAHFKEGMVHPEGSPYSYMWGVLRKNAVAIGGFSENYVGWGSEDRDFEFRLTAKLGLTTVNSLLISRHAIVFHFSHDVRTGIENKESNKENYDAVRQVAADNDWIAKPILKVEAISKRNFHYKPALTLRTRTQLSEDYIDHRKTLIIMGNGPSLGEIMSNSELLNLVRRFDTFGLNAAYRAYKKIGFYPTYFGSFDYRVCDSHAQSFEELVYGENSIKRFFFAKQSVFSDKCKSNSRFQVINFNAAPKGVSEQNALSSSFENFYDCGSSGTNAIQAGYIMGYRRFILLGVDCNYVEILDGVKDIDGIRYEVVSEIKHNPNYWFEGYQVPGDQFHKPNEKDIQLVSWEKLHSLLPAAGAFVSNCSLVSKLPMFDILPFKAVATHYNNIIIILSCEKYLSRIDLLNSLYNNGTRDDDLFLFIVGGKENDFCDLENNILHLNCGDFYEDLPKKVQSAIRFCVENFSFNRLIKTDDDVLINFEKFYQVLTPNFDCDYFGKRTPTCVGIKPNSKWHFGKVSDSSLHGDLPFEVEPPPEFWAGGGLYVLSRKACVLISDDNSRALSRMHLYEDFMIGDILHRHGISAKTWDSMAQQGDGEWCVTDLRKIFDEQLCLILDDDKLMSSVSIHCGPYHPYYSVNEEKLEQIYSTLSVKLNQSKKLSTL